MPEMVIASAEDIRRVIEAFWDMPWPQPKSVVMSTAAQLGWSVDVDLEDGGAYFDTGYGTGDAMASAAVVGTELAKRQDYTLGDLMELKVPLTSPGDAADAAHKRALTAASRSIVKIVTETVGAPSGKIAARSRVFWDTPTGGRITVQKLPATVTLVIGSEGAADIERGEARRGAVR